MVAEPHGLPWLKASTAMPITMMKPMATITRRAAQLEERAG